MSTEEFRRSLAAAGIIDSEGKLEGRYKRTTNHKIGNGKQR